MLLQLKSVSISSFAGNKIFEAISSVGFQREPNICEPIHKDSQRLTKRFEKICESFWQSLWIFVNRLSNIRLWFQKLKFVSSRLSNLSGCYLRADFRNCNWVWFCLTPTRLSLPNIYSCTSIRNNNEGRYRCNLRYMCRSYGVSMNRYLLF